MPPLDLPALQRPSFFEGQRLMADDLADVQTYHRELRWLHNRSLHNWGIALGLAVTGKRGEKAVRLQGGVALDCRGRELILSETQELPIPAVAGASDGSGPATYYLTLRYAEDADLVPEIRNGVFGTSAAVRRPEQPLLRVQTPAEDFQLDPPPPSAAPGRGTGRPAPAAGPGRRCGRGRQASLPGSGSRTHPRR